MIQSEVYFLLRQKEITERRRISQELAAQESGINPTVLNRLIVKVDQADIKAKGVSKETLAALRKYFNLDGETHFHLAKIMQARGLTQKDVSRMANVSISAVNRAVNNNLDFYRFGVLDKLMRGLQLNNLEELLDSGGILAYRL